MSCIANIQDNIKYPSSNSQSFLYNNNKACVCCAVFILRNILRDELFFSYHFSNFQKNPKKFRNFKKSFFFILSAEIHFEKSAKKL